jgi:catechol 2,3-dioxygenase-like lactoylglutathione lyase family enzyme
MGQFPAEGMEATHILVVQGIEPLRDRGAEFLTPPVESEWEVRAFFRDPDGHLMEISEAK